jgi:hypothetical protein
MPPLLEQRFSGTTAWRGYLEVSSVRVYGCIYDLVTLFTWYGHKNLVNTVLTAAVSDLLCSTLWLQWQCLI